MSDDTATNTPAPAGDAPAATTESATNPSNTKVTETTAPEAAIAETKDAEKKSEEAVTENKPKENTSNTAAEAKPADDVEMKDAPKETAPAESTAETENDQKDEGAAANVAGGQATDAADKNKSRRKSTGASGATAKKLNKKASKAKLTHLDAQPGDYYFVKLKGHPQWPAVVCDEDMLPQTLIKTRPVTAARQDGTYREDYADGGKRANDRTFPVMYLYTNEFSWVRNTDLSPLDASTVLAAINDKMRKDLKQAYEIASHAHPLDHFKEILQSFQEEIAARIQAVKDTVATPKKSSKKGKAAAAEDDEEDLEMPDADEDEDDKPKKSKKRKAEEDAAPPQESAKKTKIKITSNSTPKAANGAATPKGSKATEQKSAKSKSKAKAKGEEKKAEVPQKEPELSAEDKHQRKEKEVLFLRHKLQKGLLARDEEPKEEEMKTMSDYVTKLETFPDLEVDIIRKTKINKVLKAILKLGTIPREAEFKFKDRSQTLLDKWNKLLADDATPANGANGVNGKSAEPDASKDDADKSEKTNGAKANGVTEDSPKDAKSTKTPEAADAGSEAVEAAA